MGDNGGSFDPCECVWNHEMAMRRLLSLLRQSQSYCTDTECFYNESQTENSPTNFILIAMFIAFALFMYYLRPNSSRVDDAIKPNNNTDGSPPTPPSAI